MSMFERLHPVRRLRHITGMRLEIVGFAIKTQNRLFLVLTICKSYRCRWCHGRIINSSVYIFFFPDPLISLEESSSHLESRPQGGERGPNQCYTFDCWKQVLRDESPQPSEGRLLKDVLADPRVLGVYSVDQADESNVTNDLVPSFVIENKWNERFRITFVNLENARSFGSARQESLLQAAHAERID